MHKLLVLIIFATLSPEMAQRQAIPTDNARHSEAGQKNAQASPAVTQPDIDKHSKIDSDNNENKGSGSHPFDGLSMTLTIIIAIAACVQAGAATWQGCIYKRQSHLMSRSLRIAAHAANASRDSANASQDAVSASEEHTVRELRAYIGIHQVGIQGHNTAQSMGVGFTLINHGKTHASKLNMIGALDLLPYPLPEGLVLPEPDARDKQDGIVFPNMANPMIGWVWERTVPPLTLEMKNSLFSKQTRQEVYAHGVVTYEDVFGKSRVTRFCYVLNPHSVVRNESGDILHDAQGRIQFQWAPVANRNNME